MNQNDPYQRRLGGSERRLGRAGEAAELCGAAELLGAQGKAEQRLGGAERRLGGAAEAAELCGAAEILGVPLTALYETARPSTMIVLLLSFANQSKTGVDILLHRAAPFAVIPGINVVAAVSQEV